MPTSPADTVTEYDSDRPFSTNAQIAVPVSMLLVAGTLLAPDKTNTPWLPENTIWPRTSPPGT